MKEKAIILSLRPQSEKKMSPSQHSALSPQLSKWMVVLWRKKNSTCKPVNSNSCDAWSVKLTLKMNEADKVTDDRVVLLSLLPDGCTAGYSLWSLNKRDAVASCFTWSSAEQESHPLIWRWRTCTLTFPTICTVVGTERVWATVF